MSGCMREREGWGRGGSMLLFVELNGCSPDGFDSRVWKFVVVFV